MSKLSCTCGYIIYDQTDFISNKAHVIADQDYFDFQEEIENKPLEVCSSSFANYFFEVFQCAACGNLILIRENKRFDFQPIKRADSGNVLISYLGKQWKGTMSGNFRGDKGELFWHTNYESGFRQDLSLNDLRDLYYRKFEELIKLKILRHSFLTIGDKIEHNFDEE